MKALNIASPGDWQLVDIPRPTAGPGELVLKVAASGICGTDLRIVAGDYGHARLPVVLGHEFSGYVAEIGEGVTGFEHGELVSADPNVHCGSCRWCAQGAFNLCEHAAAVGVNLPGAMAEYVAVRAETAVRLGAGVDPIVGALVEPLSCVLHAFDRLGPVTPGEMLVTGGGAIGLLVLIEARARGFEVHVVEPIAGRRDSALRLGASLTAAAVDELPEGGAYTVVIDASGVAQAIAGGLARLEPRGTLVQMGVAPSALELPYSPYHLYEKEWRIIGSNSVADCFEAACLRAAELAPELRTLVTRTFAIEDFEGALAAMKDPTTIKVQVTF